MLGYICLALVLAIVFFGLALVSGQLFMAAFNHGQCFGHRYPYFVSVQYDRKNSRMPLVNQPEIKALYSSILDCAKPRFRAGSAANIEVQFRFLFVSEDMAGFQPYPEGAWVATLVETLKNGHTIRTEFCDDDPRQMPTAVCALYGLCRK